MKKRFLIFISLLLALSIFVFSGCGGEARIKYIGNEENYSTLSGEFATSGLATELSESVNLTLSAQSLTRSDKGEFPQTDISKLEANRRSTVEVYSLLEEGTSAGSGVFIGFTPTDANNLSKGGIAYIVTCFHVIDSAYGVNIRDLDGHIFSAGLIGGDTEDDIALLWARVDFEVTVATFGDSEDTLVGETVYAIGNPTGTLGGTVTRGIISAKEREITVENKDMTLLQIDSAINSGSSGGGLYSADGYLVGLTNAGVTYKDGLGFAIPSSTILKSVNELASTYKDEANNSYGYINGRASIGVSLSLIGTFYYTISGSTDNTYSTLDNAILINTITETGSLGKSGKIEAGRDIIKSIEMGSDTYTPTSTLEALNFIKDNENFKVGNTFKLNLLRWTGKSSSSYYTRIYEVEEVTVEIEILQLIYCPPAVPSTTTQTVVTDANVIAAACSQTDVVSDSDLVYYSTEAKIENYENLTQVTEYKSYFGDFLDNSVFSAAIQDLVRADDSDSCLTDNRKSSVEIYSSTSSGGSAGSGVIIGFTKNATSDGGICYVVTCHHCIENAYQTNMKDIYGNTYALGLIGSDKKTDVAVLWTEIDYTPSVAKFGESASLNILDDVYAIGNPTGSLGGTVTKGIVSALSRHVLVDNRYMELIQIDSAVNSGSSGGGLFSTDGLLVGLVNAGSEYKDGIGFAIPSDTVLSVANELLKNYKDDVYNSYGYVNGRIDYYSIAFDDVTYFFSDSSVVSVTEIDENCSFYSAGLRAGDTITGVSDGTNGYTISSVATLSVVVSSYNLKIGDKLTLQISRGGQKKEITAVLGQYIYKPTTKTLT